MKNKLNPFPDSRRQLAPSKLQNQDFDPETQAVLGPWQELNDLISFLIDSKPVSNTIRTKKH